VLFFSSFFTYPEGVKAAFEAYSLWTKTGSKDHTQNGMWAYFEWGLWSDRRPQAEMPIFVLSALGTTLAFVKARHRFAMFAGLWALGLLAAYTLIPYKTPWLALSFLLPMCLVAGYGINELVKAKNASLRMLGVMLTLAASVWMAYQTYDTNFVRYADEDMPYVYAHTKREFLDLMAEIDRYAEKSGKGKEAKIEIVSPDYWPMTWDLNKYGKAYFQGRLVDATTAEMIVAKKGDQDAEVIRRYSARYEYVGSYALRPGVDLVLLVRKDLADGAGEELYKLGK
jgi:predicted membrane-bound mannosyltransferase